jgi:LacI family transcriptional regulator
MVTIKQLAKMAGVSPSTVMNVVHGRTHKVNDETLARVRKIIADTNYVTNMGGRLLKKRDSRLIGVVITWALREEQNVGQDPFFGEIIGALEREIRSHGYVMMLYTSGNVDESIAMAKSWLVEGLIVLGCLPDDCACFVRRSPIPLVFIDSYFHDDGLPYINVGLDDRRGGYLITEYLIRQGHRRVAFLANNGRPPSGLDGERLAGYQDALHDNGLPVADGDYFPISHRDDERHDFLCSFAASVMRRYSALVFSSDFLAVDAMVTLYDLGIRVPVDVSICGFDDNIFAAKSRPRLTTVRQVVPDKAIHAVAMLLRLIRQEPLEQRICRLGVSLTIGDSVRLMRGV